MNGTWNLKIFISISMGLHFLIFSIFSLFLPDFKIDNLPALNIEVSLLPLVIEESQPIKLAKNEELPLKRKAMDMRPEEKILVREEKREETVFKEIKEAEEPESPSPIQTEMNVVSMGEPQRPSLESEKQTIESKKEETMVIASSKSPTPIQIEMNVVSMGEPQRSPLEIKKRAIESQKEEAIVIASSEGPIPKISSSEKSQMAMKNPSHPEEEIIFVQPKYAERPKPIYPREARKKGYEGEVFLRVEVLSNGLVGQIEVKSSSGYEVLDRSAADAVKQWRFIPAKKDESPISTWVNIPIKFRLQ